LCPFACNYD